MPFLDRFREEREREGKRREREAPGAKVAPEAIK